MVAVCYLLALLDARPSGPPWSTSWLSSLLSEHLASRIAQVDEALGRQSKLRGWSVGAVVGNETFVQARPQIRGNDLDPSDDILRTPAACTIANFCVEAVDAQVGHSNPQIRIARFRRWIGARCETDLDPELRGRLRAQLPEFLARGTTLGNDGELVFLSFLGLLHRVGGLGSSFAPADLVRKALVQVRALLAVPSINLMVTDGRTLGVLHHGGTMLAIDAPSPKAPRGGVTVDDPRLRERGNVFWLDPGPPPSTPLPGAERIAEGVFTVDPQRPHHLTRE